ncbi:MAG: phosphotransferase enzyme family protein [Limisphaerales bacterium]
MKYDGGPFLDDLCRTLELVSSPKLIRSNTNLIYDCGDSILRLTPNSFRSEDEVRRELHWMAFVGGRTSDVVHLIGEGTRQFVHRDESFTAAVLEKIEGKPVEKDQWNASHFEQLGRLTGMMHRIGQDYSPSTDVDLTHWNEIPEADLVKHLPDDDRELPHLSRLATEYLNAMPRGGGALRSHPLRYPCGQLPAQGERSNDPLRFRKLLSWTLHQ